MQLHASCQLFHRALGSAYCTLDSYRLGLLCTLKTHMHPHAKDGKKKPSRELQTFLAIRGGTGDQCEYKQENLIQCGDTSQASQSQGRSLNFPQGPLKGSCWAEGEWDIAPGLLWFGGL